MKTLGPHNDDSGWSQWQLMVVMTMLVGLSDYTRLSHWQFRVVEMTTMGCQIDNLGGWNDHGSSDWLPYIVKLSTQYCQIDYPTWPILLYGRPYIVRLTTLHCQLGGRNCLNDNSTSSHWTCPHHELGQKASLTDYSLSSIWLLQWLPRVVDFGIVNLTT